MGESRRKQLAGYVVEPVTKIKTKPKRIVIAGHGGMGTVAMLSALMASYPKFPND